MQNIFKKILAVLIVITVCISNSYFLTDVLAKEETTSTLDDYKDKTEVGAMLDDNQEITTMDENGNVHPLEEMDVINRRQVMDVQPRISNSSVAVVNFRTKSSSSYNTEYTEVTTGRAGYTNGYYAADGAFLGYDNESNPTKVKFMQAGVVGWVNVNEVQVLEYTSSAVNTLSKYYVKNGRIYHGISTNLASSNYGSALDYGPKPSYLKEGVDYYSYDGHYFYEGSTYASYAKMLNDYRNNTRANSVNSSSPYYNYYEYLSHRSITAYSAVELNNAIASMVTASENSYGRTSKLRNMADAFIENQNKYGTNALLMIGVAANESAWGCSRIAAEKNNLFGHAAYDSDPGGSANGYSSVEYSIYYHSSQFISKGYLDPVTDGRYFGANLGDKGSGINVKYASDPYWGEKAAAVCWKIDSYLGSKDSYKYTIGIKDTINTNHSVINIKSDAVSNSNTLYSTYPKSKTTTLKNQAPANYPFIILKNGEKNNYYKIQSDGAVNSNRTGIINMPSQAEYSFDKDYGYIPKSSVTVVSNGFNSSSSIAQNTENVTGQPTGKDSSEPTISYSANSQDIGWLEQVTEPNTAGTTGRSLDLYQIKISLANAVKSAKLSAKVYSDGKWLTYDKITADTEIGNADKALQIVNFNLSNQAGYRLQYRVHSADIGWQPWVNQGEDAGISGKNIQAIDFKLVRDGSVIITKPSIYYQAHISQDGWLDYVGDSEIAGDIEKSNALEAFKIGIDNISDYQLNVKTYDKVNGWVNYDNVKGDTIIGSTGKSLSLQAINATLNNNDGYKLQYRTYLSNQGWSDWTNQGSVSGVTSGDNEIKAVMFRIIQDLSISSVTLNKQETTLVKGASETLKATINPSDTTDSKVLTWTTSDSKVATVDSNGKVTGVSEGNATITVRTSNGKTASCKVTVIKQVSSVVYKTYIEGYGWQDLKKDGELSGTSGESKRIEAIRIALENQKYSGDIEYQSHVVGIGWQSKRKNGELSGTEGQSKRIEAVRINLTGEMEKNYDVYYRVFAQDYGLLDWAKNGASAGTEGLSKRIETIEIMLVKKGEKAPGSTAKPFIQKNISYQSHIVGIGWQEWKNNGDMSGTSGESKRIEAIRIALENQKYSGDIEYQSHVVGIGWQSKRKNGELSGTEGQSKRIEAVRINLTGEMEKNYDVYYRVFAQDYGLLDWAKNGASAGTEGLSKRIETIEIMLVKKGEKAPGSTAKPFIQKNISYQSHIVGIGWQEWKNNGDMSGTSGESKRIEAIRIALENQKYSGDIEYQSHVVGIGWQSKRKNGELSGTEGQSKRIEAVRINLTGEMEKNYDVYYRVFAQDYGLLDWAKNGASAGTEGLSKRIETIEIMLVKKGEKAPGSTAKPFIKK
ncbi:MAG: glucosaminidase domain-containing protein [Thomasclavelia spiroformis]|uniref:glucosaminidase domain-containing protein n=2 Tax=Thomasclavelia spiroformis TaxID=29348 RepID=UPI00399F5BFB